MNLNDLDFTNQELIKWLNDCPFDIWHFRQNWNKKEYTKEDPLGLKGCAKEYKAVDISVQIPIQECPFNIRYYFKDNEALAKVEAEYTETFNKMQKAMNSWIYDNDLTAKESYDSYKAKLRTLETNLEKKTNE